MKYPSHPGDLAIPFGLWSSPQIFTRFADVLQSIIKQIGGVQNIQHYLNDFLVAGPPPSAVSEADLRNCLSLAENLGVPIAPEKNGGSIHYNHILGLNLGLRETGT